MKRRDLELSTLVCLVAAVSGFSAHGRCAGDEPRTGGFASVTPSAAVAQSSASAPQSGSQPTSSLVPGEPGWFLLARETTGRHVEVNRRGPTIIADRFAATEEGAKNKTRELFKKTVKEWLWPQAPRDWNAPDSELSRLVLQAYTSPVYSDVGVVFLTGYQADLSPEARSHLVDLYQNDLARQRLYWMGGIVAFVLVCLGSMGGYIRADEATRGYYTNRLRLAAAAAVGAAGAAIYHIVT
jgi:hypothetical protein